MPSYKCPACKRSLEKAIEEQLRLGECCPPEIDCAFKDTIEIVLKSKQSNVQSSKSFVTPTETKTISNYFNQPRKPISSKKWLLITSIVAVILTLIGFSAYMLLSSKVKSVSLIPSSLSLVIGSMEQQQLMLSIDPAKAKNKAVTWKSSNPTIADVNDQGLVTAKSAGTATISVKTDDGGKTAACEVTVIVQKFTVSFNTNGGSNIVSQTIKSGEKATRPSNPSKSGHTFVGWFADNNFANEWSFANEVKNNINLYAKWKENTGGVSVPGGTYTGEMQNNQPHGMGTIRYNSRTLIDSRDMKKRYAEAGQYITGEFYNGRLVQGKLFDSGNNQLETIVIGRAN